MAINAQYVAYKVLPEPTYMEPPLYSPFPPVRFNHLSVSVWLFPLVKLKCRPPPVFAVIVVIAESPVIDMSPVNETPALVIVQSVVH